MTTYLKLRKPGQARAAFAYIPVPTGEIYTEVIHEMDEEQICTQLRVWERNGYEPRRFLLWANVKGGGLQDTHDRLLEVAIPGRGDIEPCVIITNYDAFLVSGNNLVERLFRYEPPLERDGEPGAGVLQHGDNTRLECSPEGYERVPDPT